MVAEKGLDPPPPGLSFPSANQLSSPATVRRHGSIYRSRERAAYKKPVRGMSSKPGRSTSRRTAGPCTENPRKTPLFRPEVGISAGTAGRRDHRGVAGIGRRRMHLRIGG